MQIVDKVLERVTVLMFSPTAGEIFEPALHDGVCASVIARIIAQGPSFTARLKHRELTLYG